jgi:prophage regulatory protein
MSQGLQVAAQVAQKAVSDERIMLDAEVREKTGLSHTTRWREIRAKRFPAPLTISKGRVGWLQSEVEAWLQQRIEARRERAA